jgi:regulator of CtrA degradation
VSVTAAPTAFFNKTYDEAMDLLVEMRDYVAFTEPHDRSTLSPAEGVRFCCATLRVTARLTQIMAWLLAQKAVHSGELSNAEIVAKNGPLAAIEVCMQSEGECELAELPQYFRGLLDRSHRLYIRVARLDEMVRRQTA